MTASDPVLLAIDQGTSSSRAIAFTLAGEAIASDQQAFKQIYPQSGWVEHDAEVIWATTLSTARNTVSACRAKGRAIAAIGLTNQRETTVVWDRRTGAPIHNAIVWQDRRTADVCRALTEAGHEAEVIEKTGLRLDPYFSATKLAWILDHVAGARQAAAAGHLLAGTIDTFLIWRLTGGARHVTDATNASRTALYDMRHGRWDAGLCALFNVPMAMLPEVLDCAADFGTTEPGLLGEALPIRGVAGDQQAATIGQAVFQPGDVKSTYGTGAFLIQNTGTELVRSSNRLLSTIAYQLDGQVTYGLEGSILSAGSTIQWLRDGLGLFSKSSEVEALAASVTDTGGVYLVPAFTGLGAPWWDPDARGSLVGLSRASGRAEIARAGLDSAVYQTRDLLDAMAADGIACGRLKVDGGMADNALFLQRLSDVLDVEVVRPVLTETTAFGAACLAGLGSGLFQSLDDIAALWKPSVTCHPKMDTAARTRDLSGWKSAVEATRAFRPI
ncbi:glycerol kinase GlpK [Brevundimonas variabilis]|uniref:glycerol kinase n=1 Tax=Brevundimonas variabilis TaxID=74312 RepID=A0A7W9CF13_9CAUL|nr:glycerol kinase [Brevundimonas variabilis]